MGHSIVDGKYSEAFDVTVPGNIQKDYAAHMGWGDVNFMDNCRKFLDIEDCFWSYKTDIKGTQKDGERVFFATHGIEYEYDIILNGNKLIHHEGMFTKVELDITDELAQGNGNIFVSIGDLENDKHTMAIGEYEHRRVSVHPSDFGMEKIAARIVGAILA